MSVHSSLDQRVKGGRAEGDREFPYAFQKKPNRVLRFLSPYTGSSVKGRGCGVRWGSLTSSRACCRSTMPSTTQTTLATRRTGCLRVLDGRGPYIGCHARPCLPRCRSRLCLYRPARTGSGTSRTSGPCGRNTKPPFRARHGLPPLLLLERHAGVALAGRRGGSPKRTNARDEALGTFFLRRADDLTVRRHCETCSGD